MVSSSPSPRSSRWSTRSSCRGSSSSRWRVRSADAVDVAVVGAGIMGAATAAELARRGLSVTLIEQFEIGHARGSSHGDARIFRLSYPDPTYVAMAQETLPLWRALEREAAEDLLVTTGGIDAGEGVEANAAALKSCGVDFELLDPSHVAHRHQVRLPGSEPVLYQSDSGVVRAERALMAFVASARKSGARIVERARVARITESPTSVAIETSDGDVAAGAVVVTAGAWAAPLLGAAGIGLDVRPTRETVAYFEHDGPRPPTVVEWGAPAVYALYSPSRGIKAGEHIAGPAADPDEEGAPDQGSIDRLSRWVAERFPGAHPAPVFAETCLYTNTSDQHFVVRRHGRIVVGSPCSGHGFKFAPLIGMRLADLATT